MIREPAIRIRGLTKAFGTQPVLTGLDLDVAAGTIFALLGPNGAGKTTLIRILTTLLLPDGGSARVAGHDAVADPDGVRRSISLTGQYAAVDEVLTGRENAQLIARLAGLPRRAASERAADLLDQFDLVDAADKRVATYSGGMRRRLDLALSLVITPTVLFLDEPTTGLDTRSRQALWGMIRSLADQGITVFLTTQYLEEADHLADRIAVIDHGAIVAEGTAAELKARVGAEVVQIHSAAGQLLYETATDGTVSDLRKVVNSSAGRQAEAQISIRKPTMDDVFLALTGTGQPTAPEREERSA
jgi:daunorubicin resistance ABC transporter ATP-binding subunit